MKKLVAHGLGISPADYREAKRWLMDIDLIQEAETRTGKRILIEKVERLNHCENYRRIGIQWSTAKQRTPRRRRSSTTLDRVVEHPSSIGDLDAGSATLEKQSARLSLRFGARMPEYRTFWNSKVSTTHRCSGTSTRRAVAAFLAICDTSAFRSLLVKTSVTAPVQRVSRLGPTKYFSRPLAVESYPHIGSRDGRGATVWIRALHWEPSEPVNGRIEHPRQGKGLGCLTTLRQRSS